MIARLLVVNAAHPITIKDVEAYDIEDGVIVLECTSGVTLISTRQLISMSIMEEESK